MKKALLVLGLGILTAHQLATQTLTGSYVGRYTTGLFDAGATEIAAYDPTSQRIFSVNGSTGNVDLIDFSNPASPSLHTTIDLSLVRKFLPYLFKKIIKNCEC